MSKWVSRPDDVDALVEKWADEFPQYLRAESKTQYGGHPVWALTVTDHEQESDQKPAAMFFKPHAHEPAPIAAQMNFFSQLLTGQELDGTPTALPREEILANTVLCFMPDANPAGTAAAPVDAWDGSQYTNEEFWAWMRGIDAETGKMWKRVDLWDDTVEDPLPLRYGIVYEQISEHKYVEPNRHHRSSLFQWIFELRERREGEGAFCVAEFHGGHRTVEAHGDSVRVALLRAFVMSRFGDTVGEMLQQPQALDGAIAEQVGVPGDIGDVEDLPRPDAQIGDIGTAPR